MNAVTALTSGSIPSPHRFTCFSTPRALLFIRFVFEAEASLVFGTDLSLDFPSMKPRDLLFSCCLLFAFAVTTGAQSRADDAEQERTLPMGSPAAEAMARQLIEHEKKEHRENIERAQEVARLSQEIQRDIEKKARLDAEGARRLERIEKLARRIRSEAGGSDMPGALKDAPTTIEQAAHRLSRIAKELSAEVEKTPRQVISASIIEKSNEIIELARLIRRMS